MIDCIAWGSLDAAKIIESANYSIGMLNDQEHAEHDENGTVEELK